MLNITAISGSLRNQSFNTALLKTAVKFMPIDTSMALLELGPLPLYNEDLIPDKVTESVLAFRAQLETADGVLIASPEYNYSMPGVLKNALDWATTNTISNFLDNKPIAIMGASKTVFGTVRAQLHLRQVLAAVNAKVLQKPEVFIRRAQDVIRDNGTIDDPRTLSKLQKLVLAFIDLIKSDK